jgi:ABC-2 type transport system permease protein
MAFHNLTSNEAINTIPIALIEKENINNEFINRLQSVEIAKDKKMFKVQTTSLETAEKLFKEDKIKGYVDYNNNEANLYIKENGIEQSIIKTFLDSYMQKSQTIMNIVSLNPQAINNGVLQDTAAYQNYITDGSNNGKNPDFTIIYFYTLIALTCMFGSNWGFREMLDIQADQSAIGARINVAPTHKLKLLICNLFAALTLHLISILMLLAFLNYVLNVKFGSDIGMILITCIIGSLCGMSLGAMVCVTLKTNIKVREAILTTVAIGGGFLAGRINISNNRCFFSN